MPVEEWSSAADPSPRSCFRSRRAMPEAPASARAWAMLYPRPRAPLLLRQCRVDLYMSQCGWMLGEIHGLASDKSVFLWVNKNEEYLGNRLDHRVGRVSACTTEIIAISQ